MYIKEDAWLSRTSVDLPSKSIVKFCVFVIQLNVYGIDCVLKSKSIMWNSNRHRFDILIHVSLSRFFMFWDYLANSEVIASSNVQIWNFYQNLVQKYTQWYTGEALSGTSVLICLI